MKKIGLHFEIPIEYTAKINSNGVAHILANNQLLIINDLKDGDEHLDDDEMIKQRIMEDVIKRNIRLSFMLSLILHYV